LPTRRWYHASVSHFLRQLNSGVGFWSPDVLQYRSHDPEWDNEAPLERGAMTRMRINSPAYYDTTSRDLTNGLNPITLARFMDCVDISFDEFFNHDQTIYIWDAMVTRPILNGKLFGRA